MKAFELEIFDPFGNIAVNNHGKATLALADDPSGWGAVFGNLTATINKGIAIFNKVGGPTVAGSYMLHATAGGLTINSSSFTVVPGAAKKLVFHQPLAGLPVAGRCDRPLHYGGCCRHIRKRGHQQHRGGHTDRAAPPPVPRSPAFPPPR